MHVAILNQTFYPDVAATAQLMWDLARHLDARGHRVSAVTSRSFYGTDRRHEKGFEKIGNISIHRLEGTALGKRSIVTRMLDFGTYYLAAGWHLQRSEAPDVILALTSPPMVATLGALTKEFRQSSAGAPIRLVYHIMDLYPDAAVAGGVMRPAGIVDRVLRGITRRTLGSSDAIIALGRDMKRRLIADHGYDADPERIHVVTPWADGEQLTPLEKSANPLVASLGLSDTFNVVYSGNLGKAHDLRTMIGAIEATREDEGLRWVFIGGGTRFEELRKEADAAKWPHVKLMPFQDRAGLNQSLNLADVHLVSQLPEFTGVVVPSKLFGILAVGRPSIMVGPADAECSHILIEHDAGFVVPNGDGGALVERVRELRRNAVLRRAMGERARRAFETEYDRRVACGRIEKILSDVVEGGR